MGMTRGERRTGRRTGRRLALGLLVLLLVLLAVHTFYWRWAEDRLEAGLADWAAAQRARGWSVAYGQAQRGGWPLAARLRVAAVAIEGGSEDIPGGLAWRADRLTLAVRLLDPRRLLLEPDGMQALRLGLLPALHYTADQMRAEVPLAAGAPAHAATLQATDLRAGIPGGALTVGLLQGHVELRPAALEGEPALALSATAEAIALPPGIPWALGGRISSLALDGAINGPLPRVPGLAARAAAWRDGGGAVTIQRLALGWGPLGLAASATLALDMRLQPMGTGTARIVGYAETLDALAAGGAISPGAALAAKALAGLVAKAPEAGGPAEVEVPLTLQDRTLSVGRIPLARLPALAWPPD